MNGRIGKNKTWEFYGPWYVSHIGSQLDFWMFDCSFRWKGDHTPQFNIILVLLGFRIFEFDFYDDRHKDDLGSYIEYEDDENER